MPMRIEPSELFAPEILAQRVVRGPFGAPVHRLRIDLLARAVEDADLGAREIARIALHARNDFLLDDRCRHSPGRVEVDDLDMGDDLRRGMFGVADDGDIAVGDAAVVDRLDRGRRQVDHDIPVAKREVRARQTIGARGDLIEPHLRRHIDRLQRRARDDTRLAQAHAGLEALDCRRQLGVPRLAARMGRIEIAFDREALAQFRHCGSLGARMQRDDVGRPAAGVDDRAIPFGRLGGGEERVGLDSRRRVARQGRFERRRGWRDLLRFRQAPSSPVSDLGPPTRRRAGDSRRASPRRPLGSRPSPRA